MPLEIEAKIKVDSHDVVRARLGELGADRVGRVLESNHIFDNAERTLLAGGCGLRVRGCRLLEGPPVSSSMTFKGPRQQSQLKIRDEITIEIDDADVGCELLMALGYVEFLYFEKRRESWRLDGCEVELDELPYLGFYVEIEGPNEQRIRKAFTSLGLDGVPVIGRSYIALLVEYCRDKGISGSRIVFDLD